MYIYIYVYIYIYIYIYICIYFEINLSGYFTEMCIIIRFFV